MEVGIFELMYWSESNNNTEEILFIFVVGILDSIPIPALDKDSLTLYHSLFLSLDLSLSLVRHSFIQLALVTPQLEGSATVLPNG